MPTRFFPVQRGPQVFGKKQRVDADADGASEASAEQAQILRHPGELSLAEKKQELHRQENDLAKGKRSWAKEGRALIHIKERELYVVTAGTWEDYLRGWGYKGRQARNLMRAAALVDPNIREVRHAISLGAALRLSKLKDQEQEPCLREAIAASGSVSPTARDIVAATAKLWPEKAPRAQKTKRRAKGLVRLNLPSGALTIKPTGVILLKPRSRSIDPRQLIEEAFAKLTAPPQADAA